jgi:hypothetical protein
MPLTVIKHTLGHLPKIYEELAMNRINTQTERTNQDIALSFEPQKLDSDRKHRTHRKWTRKDKYIGFSELHICKTCHFVIFV